MWNGRLKERKWYKDVTWEGRSCHKALQKTERAPFTNSSHWIACSLFLLDSTKCYQRALGLGPEVGGGVFLSCGELRKWLRVKMWAKICHQGDKRVSFACHATCLLKGLTCGPAAESLLSMYKALSWSIPEKQMRQGNGKRRGTGREGTGRDSPLLTCQVYTLGVLWHDSVSLTWWLST